MNGSKADFQHVLLQMLDRSLHPTAGDKRFLRVVYVAVGLFVLSIFLELATSNPFWPLLAMVVFVAAVAAALVWRIWDITKHLKAQQAAGVPTAPLTLEDTLRLVAFGWSVLSIVVGWVVVGFFLSPKEGWGHALATFAPLLVWALGLFGVALWYRWRRFHRRGAQQS